MCGGIEVSKVVCAERGRGGKNRSPELCLGVGVPSTPFTSQPPDSGLDLYSRNDLYSEAAALSFRFPSATQTCLRALAALTCV